MAAEVSFDEAQAVVTFHPDRVSGEDLVRALQEAGFEAHVIGDKSTDPSRAARKSRDES